MNKEFIYFNNKISVCDENGHFSDPINYNDNVNEILKLQNDYEVVENSMKNKIKIIDETQSLKKRKPLKNLIFIGIPVLLIPLLVYGVSDFNIAQTISSLTTIVEGKINLYEMLLIVSSIPSTVIATNFMIKDIEYNNNIDYVLDTNNKLLEEDRKTLLNIKENISKLTEVQTSDVKYNNFDVVDIDTNNIVMDKRKILKR